MKNENNFIFCKKTILRLVILVISIKYTSGAKQGTYARERYDPFIPQLTIGNGANGVHFYAHPGTIPPAIIYPAIQPTVFLPGQYGLEAQMPQIPNANLIPSNYKDMVYETSTPSYHKYISHSRYRPPVRPHTKSYNTRPSGNGLSSYSSPTYSIQQSIDLSDVTPNLLTTAVPPLTGTTYGPPRPIDLSSKRQNMLYHKGPPRPYYGPPKSIRGGYNTFTHKHRDHYHTHHYPLYHSTPLYHTKPYTLRPTYSPPRKEPPQNFNYYQSTYNPVPFPISTTPQPTEKPHNYHAHPTPKPEPTRIKFPEPESNQIFDHQFPRPIDQQNTIDITYPGSQFGSKEPHPDLTQALIGNSNEIKNNDVSIPYKLPADATKKDGDKQYQHYNDQTLSYFGSAPDNVFQTSQLLNNEPNSQQDGNTLLLPHQYQHDLRGADTIKIPVAVFPLVTAPGGMVRFNVKRSDDTTQIVKDSFEYSSPESNSSEWVPMNGGSSYSSVKKPARRMLDEVNSQESAEYQSSETTNFARDSEDLIQINYQNHRFVPKKNPTNIISIENYKFSEGNGDVGDIITGKIGGNYNPFSEHKNVQNIDLKNGESSNIVTSKISFGGHGGPDVRKAGKVIDDVNPLLSRLRGSDNDNETSDLVVSSVLKFN